MDITVHIDYTLKVIYWDVPGMYLNFNDWGVLR
jgi:hypothetical protein